MESTRDGFEVHPFGRDRNLVLDAGWLAGRRHIIHGLLEADVTDTRRRLSASISTTGHGLSFTAFIVACLAQAVAANPTVQAYRDWRGRRVVFSDVDVVTPIEAERDAVAISHIVRAANRKSVDEISDEIREIQARPERSEQSKQKNKLVALGQAAPWVARRAFYWALLRNPHWLKSTAGTCIVTSVGMFMRRGSGGWGVGFLPFHTLGLTVGGIAQRPGVVEGRIEIREYLNLTVSFDHDIVDGAPAARFARRLVELMECGYGLVESE